MYYIYNLLLYMSFIGVLPLIFLWVILNSQGMRERLGFLPPETLAKFRDRPTVWIHAASVGEVGVVAALVPELKRVRPGWGIAVSTMTTTGYRRARELIKGVDLIFHAPLDLPPIIRRVLKELNPVLFLLTETELWPNLVLEAKGFGVRVALVNGRVSPRSSWRYGLVRGLMERTLAGFALFCVQTEEDRDRLLHLGADPRKVSVIGNLKFDLIRLLNERVDPEVMHRSLCISDASRVLVAGSTRQGEEEEVVEAYLKIRDRLGDGNVVLILAPRHLNRVGEVEQILAKKGVIFHRRTPHSPISPIEEGVLILDTLRELAAVYVIADAAFVGGSLMPYGGHNPLEPAACGVPVLFGPHMDHTRKSAELLLESGGDIMVEGPKTWPIMWCG